MIHPDIRDYWLRKGFYVKQTPWSASIYSGMKYVTCIAYKDHESLVVRYFPTIDCLLSVSEKDMLSLIKLQAFL